MDQPNQPKGETGGKKLLGIIRYRHLAILIMLIGAAGFVVALLVFDEQVICLFGSTVVTMAGLAVNIAARRLGLEPVENSPAASSMQSSRAARRGRVPPGLGRQAGRGKALQEPAVSEEPNAAQQEAAAVVDDPTATQKEVAAAWRVPGLADRVMGVLESQGARVTAINCREARCILEAEIRGGKRIVILVLEGLEPAGLADARSLLAMARRISGGTGYLVSPEAHSPELLAWAADREQIRLLDEAALGEMDVF